MEKEQHMRKSCRQAYLIFLWILQMLLKKKRKDPRDVRQMKNEECLVLRCPFIRITLVIPSD